MAEPPKGGPGVRRHAKNMRARLAAHQAALEGRSIIEPARPYYPPDGTAHEAQQKRQQEIARKQRIERFGAENRDDLTRGEQAMRAILDELGWRYTTEHPIASMILDFYVHAHKMAVEVDGGYHNLPKQRAKDKRRDRWLVSRGYLVARFTNDQVLQYPKRTKATLLSILNPRNPHEIRSRVLPSKSLQAQQVDLVQRKLCATVYAHL
jgi:very-short-patch-repair endonuclease